MQSTENGHGICVRGAVLAGIISLLSRNSRKRERVQQWMRAAVMNGTHLDDPHAAAETARALFGACARALTLDLSQDGISRSQARRQLAAAIVSTASRVLIALQEGGKSVEEIRRVLASDLAELGDLGDLPARATACEQTRLRPPGGFTNSEWSLLQEGPLFAVLHVSAAASNGPRELLREFRAADGAILQQSLDETQDALVGSAFHAGMCGHRLRQLADNYPSRRSLLNAMQNCLSVSEKIGVPARGEYGEMVSVAVLAAAKAARERVLFSRRGALETEQRALSEIDRLMR